MKIGDKVRVKNRLTKFTTYHRGNKKIVSWVRFSVPTPVHPICLYLGTTVLYNGNVEWSGSDEGNVFTRTGQISAVVVQPLDAGGRYRRPVYALPEDVQVLP